MFISSSFSLNSCVEGDRLAGRLTLNRDSGFLPRIIPRAEAVDYDLGGGEMPFSLHSPADRSGCLIGAGITVSLATLLGVF